MEIRDEDRAIIKYLTFNGRCAPNNYSLACSDCAVPLRPDQGGMREVLGSGVGVGAGRTQEQRRLELRSASLQHSALSLQTRLVSIHYSLRYWLLEFCSLAVNFM